MRFVVPSLVLASFAAAAVFSAASCSSSSETPAADAGTPDAGGADADQDVDMRPPTPAAWDMPVTRPDDGTATSNRAACMYKRGDMPAATLGQSTPIDAQIPIDTVVVVMMENHSFDNYFGRLGVYANRTDIEVPPTGAGNPSTPGAGNPDAGASDGGGGDAGTGGDGGTPSFHAWHHAPHKCIVDIDHSWVGTHAEIDNGAMDGFFHQNDGFNPGYSTFPPAAPPNPLSGDRSLEYYDETDIPFYYKLATTFAIADHYHASNPGETWSNRRFLFAASSLGIIDESFPDLTSYPFPDDDVGTLDELTKRHVDWLLYTNGLPGAGVLYSSSGASRWKPYLPNLPNTSFDNFIKAAAAGTLPGVSYVDPDIGGTNASNDEHPPGDIQLGEQFVYSVVNAVMHSPQWPHTALFITWDEHGGYYDHVSPPPACAPDGIAPMSPQTFDGFARYGVRVPFILVSPYAKKGYVGHTVYDHTSIVRFIQTKFKMPALTKRDANADPMLDLFDFSNPQFLTPPTLDAPTVDATEQTFCTAAYTKM
jgi:phospholipase C